MLTVTPLAMDKLKEYLAQNKIESPIRVMAQSSCAGTSLGLILDETAESDQVHGLDGLVFLTERGLLDDTGAVTIDFKEAEASGCGCSGGGGFVISSEKPLNSNGCGGSCASGCGC